ncbi:hypothetical protein ABK040_005980 [Willaertia magna]
MFAAARKITTATNCYQKTSNVLKTGLKNNRKFNTNKQIISTYGLTQKAFSHDVEINIQFLYENQETVMNILKEGKLESKINYDITYYDNVPQNEVLPEYAEVAKNRAATTNEYNFTTKDSWLMKIKHEGKEALEWRMTYPFVESNKSHLKEPLVSRAPMYTNALGDREIRRYLNLQQDMTQEARTGKKLATLEEDLRNRLGVVPFATYKVTESSITIHPKLDMANLQVILYDTSFGYKLGKLVCFVQNINKELAAELADHLQRILKVAGIKPLVQPHARKLIEEYLYRNRKDTHYKAMEQAGLRDDRLMDKEYAKEQLSKALETKGKTLEADEE